MLKRRGVASTIAAGVLILANAQAAAQDFPAKPVRIITTAIGGSSDIHNTAQPGTGACAQPVEHQRKAVGAGIEVVTSTPDELAATVKTEITKWSKVIKEAGIKVN